MNNSYNPYTVPDNFFEDTCRQAVSKYRARRRAIRIGVATLAVAAFILVIPLFVNRPAVDWQQKMVAGNLADMYEYDIFLQVNFTK